MDTLTKIELSYKNRSLSRLRQIAEFAIKPDQVVSWFNTPHELLGNVSPLVSCLTDDGYDRVEELIFSMLYGLPT